MNERIIVSLTTWSKRIHNIPTVLDTILNQTMPPNLIVLNLAFNEQIPDEVQAYIDRNRIEIHRTADTKVYKKLLPTLKRYPNDIIISIDDDWLYPNGMIADFIETHIKYPNNPISGNRIVFSDMICHCGCASLTKASFFRHYIDNIDDDVIYNCPCDDIVYTFFANKAGNPYIITTDNYFRNLTPFNQNDGYSETVTWEDDILKSHSYLLNRFGDIPHFAYNYLKDQYIANILHHIHEQSINDAIFEKNNQIRNSYSYKLGRVILKPVNRIRRFLLRIRNSV